MTQLKVRFTIEHHDEQRSFTTLSELNQHSFSNLLLERLTDFEIRMKLAAADFWIHQRLGQDKSNPFQIHVTTKSYTKNYRACKEPNSYGKG